MAYNSIGSANSVPEVDEFVETLRADYGDETDPTGKENYKDAIAAAAAAAANGLTPDNNLSDLTNVADARDNLGLGTAAVADTDNDNTLGANSSSAVPTQQAVKGYVDNKLNGLVWKEAVRVATLVNGTLSTAFANGQTVDGVTLATGDRILIKNQSTASQNGIYVVNASGAPTRASDADTGAELKNATVVVDEGTQAEFQWTCSNNGTITIGSTSITFVNSGGGGRLLVANNLSDVSNAATARSNLGLAIGTNVQAYDADLAALAGISSNSVIAYRGSDGVWRAATIGSGLTVTNPNTSPVLSASGGMREQTLTAYSNLAAYYYAHEAQTLAWKCIKSASFAQLVTIEKSTAAAPTTFSSVATPEDGNTGTVTLEAGAMLRVTSGGTPALILHLRRTA